MYVSNKSVNNRAYYKMITSHVIYLRQLEVMKSIFIFSIRRIHTKLHNYSQYIIIMFYLLTLRLGLGKGFSLIALFPNYFTSFFFTS